MYNQEGTPKMKSMLIFWEMRDSSMRFAPIIPKTSHHTIHKVYCQEHNSLYPKVWVTTRYFYSKRCDTFSQDCTFLEACIPRNTRDAYDGIDGSQSKHIINSQILHNLKYKVFAFNRNLHLLAPNSL